MKQKIKNVFDKMKLIMKFPNIISCFILFALCVCLLVISYVLFCQKVDFWSSICANIFAGLVTGIVICILTGIKQLSMINLKCKKVWFEHISAMLKEYREYYNK